MNNEKLPNRSIENLEQLSGEKLLKRVSDLTMELYLLNLRNGSLVGTEEFTLIGDPVGYSSAENSLQASIQLEFALAATLNPKVEEFAETNRNNKEEIAKQLRGLITSKVMTGKKILDLGCGVKPTFARVARAAGAVVYTVDVIGADEFEYIDKEAVDSKTISTEIDNHIVIDLHKPDALEVILNRTKGNFTLVTSAHLETGWGGYSFSDGEDIAMPLLKKDGMYFNANRFQFGDAAKIKV